MKTLTKCILVLTLCITGVASANTLSSFYVIPFANHIPRGTDVEASDVAIANYQAVPVHVNLTLISYGLHNTSNNVFPINGATVPAYGSVLITDVLKDYQGEFASVGASLGAILASSDDGRAFAITSRSYLKHADGSTVGYTVPATSDFLKAATTTASGPITTIIPGVRNNGQYRTQIGFVIANAEGVPTLVTLALRDAAGLVLGTTQFFVSAGLFAEDEIPSTLIADKTFDIASVEVRIQGGGAVVAYAKVIDKTTQDASLILADTPTSTSNQFGKKSPFEVLMDRNRF